MHCQYCHQRLSIFKLLSGQPFCSKEHRELYLNTQSKDAIKRLLSSFSEEDKEPGDEGKAAQPEALSPAPPKTFEPPPTPAAVEVTVAAKPLATPEPPTAPSAEQDPPEASFLKQALPDPRNRPSTLISRTVIEPPSAHVEFPVSPTPEPLLLEATSAEEREPDEPAQVTPEPPAPSLAPLELNLAPVDAPHAGPRLTAPEELEPGPPSIVSAPVAPVVVLKEPGLVSLPMVEGQAPESWGTAPEPLDVVASPPALIETQARLEPQTQPDLLTPPPPAQAQSIWPEQKQGASIPPQIPLAGALRPRSSNPRTPSPARTAGMAGLRQAGSIRDLQQPPSASGGPKPGPAVPLLPECVELCAPSPPDTEEKRPSLASPATLLPMRLSPAAVWTSRADFGSSTWRLAVGAPRLPRLGRASSDVRHLAGPATVTSATVAKQPPHFQPAAPVINPPPVQVLRETVPPARVPLTLPLSAEALPSPKPSTRQLPFRPPAPDFRPSFSKASERAKLPGRRSASTPRATLRSASELEFALSPASAAPRRVSGLNQEINVTVALPHPRRERKQFAPVASLGTRQIEQPASINQMEAAVASAPLLLGTTLHFARPVSVPPTSNALSALVRRFTIELAPLRLPPPAALVVPSPSPVLAAVDPRSPRVTGTWAPFVLRTSANIRPLWWDDALMKPAWAGQPQTSRLAQLEAARPSPLSLLTAPRAVPLCASAAALVRFERPRVIPWNVAQGETVSVPLFAHATFGRRVALPQPQRPQLTFALPGLTDANPLGVQALPPTAGKKQIALGATRFQPAALPVLPGLFQAPAVTPAAGLGVSGMLPNRATPLAGPRPYQASMGWEIRTRVETALAWTPLSAYSPAIGRATFSEGLAGSVFAPPALPPREIPALSSRQRLARALSSGFRSLFPFSS